MREHKICFCYCFSIKCTLKTQMESESQQSWSVIFQLVVVNLSIGLVLSRFAVLSPGFSFIFHRTCKFSSFIRTSAFGILLFYFIFLCVANARYANGNSILSKWGHSAVKYALGVLQNYQRQHSIL